MSGIPNTVMIAITELKSVAKREPDYEKRVDAVMQAASRHWMVTDENDQFRAAIGALLLTSSDSEAAEINAQMRLINALEAATAGIPVDWDRVLPDADEPMPPAPKVKLMERWRALHNSEPVRSNDR